MRTIKPAFAQWFTTLERQIDRLAAIETTHIQPIHADLHLGQVVAWDDGLAIIDFDGPPGRFAEC